MKTVVTVLLMIIIVDQGLNEKVTLSSCSHNGTIEFIPTDNDAKYQLKLCLSNSACIISDNNIMFKENDIMPRDILDLFDSNCSQYVTTSKQCSDSVSTCAAALPTTTTTTTEIQIICNTDSPISQEILVALLVIFAVLLAIVTIGWVWTCWTMKKKRLRMKINTTNIR